MPTLVPDGWVEYSAWSCDCRFYHPPSADLMPAPVAWEPCPESPGGINCLRMVTDWTDVTTPVGFFPRVWTEQGGTPMLAFRRLGSDFLLDVIAELDGAVRFALLEVTEKALAPDLGCAVTLDALNEGRYAYDVRGDDPDDPESVNLHSGGIGGEIGQLAPSILGHYMDGSNYTFTVSAGWVTRINQPGREVVVSPWTMAEDILVHSPATDPDGLQAGQLVMSGDALFFSTSTLKMDGTNVWDPIGGTRPFIRWIGDFTRGAADLGTDGVDLVWSEGEGKAPNDSVYPNASIMTAPFTSNPASIVPRRLRSLPFDIIGASEWQVACGHATHKGPANDVFVVRLSDGVSWVVPNVGPEQTFDYPVGITCDEVLAFGRWSGRYSYARIRLDSLGPGTQPD